MLSLLLIDLMLQPRDVECERMVYQYHYTAWPDHGVPLHALPLVTFVRNSAAANPPNSPIVVHCRWDLHSTFTLSNYTFMVQGQNVYRQNVYRQYVYRQNVYGTKGLQDKMSTGTKGLQDKTSTGQNVYRDKTSTGQNIYRTKHLMEQNFVPLNILFCRRFVP